MIATEGMVAPFISPPAPPSLCGLRARGRSVSYNLRGNKLESALGNAAAARIQSATDGAKLSKLWAHAPTNEAIDQPTNQQPVPNQPRRISSRHHPAAVLHGRGRGRGRKGGGEDARSSGDA